MALVQIFGTRGLVQGSSVRIARESSEAEAPTPDDNAAKAVIAAAATAAAQLARDESALAQAIADR